jgi:hypothetical protein
MPLQDQNHDIAKLREAALSGQIHVIRATLEEWPKDHGAKELFVKNTCLLLSEAVNHNLVSVVECLLDFHVPINAQLFLIATRNTSYRILEAFLHHGWDINTPIDSYTPPALA